MRVVVYWRSLGDTEAVRASEGGMPYGRQIAEEEQRQDRGGQVSEGKARRQEGESKYQEHERLSCVEQC